MNQNGQAAVEYVLILVVTLLLGFGLAYQFNRGVRTFSEEFFGNYIDCLLRSGELPSLGAETDAECVIPEFSYQARNIASGSGGGGNGNAGGDGGNSGDPSSSKASDPNKEGEGSESSRGLGEGSSNRGLVSGGRGSFATRKRGQSGGRPSEIDANIKKEGSGSVAGVSATSSQSDTGVDGTAGRVRYISIGEIEKREEADRLAIARNQKEKDAQGRTRYVKAKTDRDPQSRIEDEDSGFSFGGFLKYLVIIAIGLAVILLLGGQALQIKKSMESE